MELLDDERVRKKFYELAGYDNCGKKIQEKEPYNYGFNINYKETLDSLGRIDYKKVMKKKQEILDKLDLGNMALEAIFRWENKKNKI